MGVLDGKSALGEKNTDGDKVNVNSYSYIVHLITLIMRLIKYNPPYLF